MSWVDSIKDGITRVQAQQQAYIEQTLSNPQAPPAPQPQSYSDDIFARATEAINASKSVEQAYINATNGLSTYHQQTFHTYVGGGTPTAAWSFFWKEASDNNLTSSIQGDEHGIYSHLYGQYGYGIWENPMKQWEKEIVLVPCVQRDAHGKATNVTAFGCPNEPDPTKFFYKHSPQEGGTGINNDGLGTGTIVLLGAAGLGAVALLSMRQ